MIKMKTMLFVAALLAGGAMPVLAQTATPAPAAPKAAAPLTPVKIGYLSLDYDARYDAKEVFAGLQLRPLPRPMIAAEMGITDLKALGDAIGFSASLDEETAKDAAGLIDKVKSMNAAGERFIIVDLPADVLDQVAAATKEMKVTLINTTAHEDYLRDRCYPNLLSTAASDRQFADALVQLLLTRNWTNVLVLEGQLPRDKELADTFIASAQRLRLNIVDTRVVTLAADSESREENNTLLVTGGVDYDVVYIADTQGDFARYLPYATQLPRPVIGSTGLVPGEWHWSWERDAASQVTSRYDKLTGTTQQMGDSQWAAWVAAKSVMTAYAKSRQTDPDQIDVWLRGPKFSVDGTKGIQLSFRPWDGQMRQPILLATADAVIETAPLPGFTHERTELDTLGTDEPEHVCK